MRAQAGGLAFPNGMALTDDGATLLVGESHRGCITAFAVGAGGALSDRRTWGASVEGSAPDGICLDADGACWYADVPNQQCVRVVEGGDVQESVSVPGLGCFACMLGGDDGRTLFVLTADWERLDWRGGGGGERTGLVLTYRAPAPHAGCP